jgi:hypothetical protein
MSSYKRWVQVGQGQFMKWSEKGQEIEGVWRGQKDGQYGPLGIVDTPDGRVSFPLHTALLQRVEAVKIGAEIRIVYRGKEKTKDGRKEFKAFDVFVASTEDIVEPAAAPDDEVPF